MDMANVESLQELLDTLISLPLQVDLRYNVAVCTECCTGVAFDWMQSHLRNKHGIRKRLDVVMEHLNIEGPTLSSTEVKAWMSEVWVLPNAIKGVPVRPGIACKECQHSAPDITSMKVHFSNRHPDLKTKDNIMKCNIQMPFQGRLKKHIQIEDAEGHEVEMDTGNDWKQALDEEFQETIAERLTHAVNGHSDIRLSSAFIAKTRWDLCVKDMDLSELQKLALAPVKSDRLHKVIICGRQYIETCCGALTIIPP